VAPTTDVTRSATPKSLDAAVAGMRRLDFVRMVEGGRPRFFVVGVGHRLPVEREVSPSVALALLETLPCRYERPRLEGRPVEGRVA
jgi:hypothetical protein